MLKLREDMESKSIQVDIYKEESEKKRMYLFCIHINTHPLLYIST